MPPAPPNGSNIDPASEWFDTLLRTGLAFSVLTFAVIFVSHSVKLVGFWRRNRLRVHLSKRDPRGRNGAELEDVPHTTAPLPALRQSYAPSRADTATVIHYPIPNRRDVSTVTDNAGPGQAWQQWRQHQPQLPEEERQ